MDEHDDDKIRVQALCSPWHKSSDRIALSVLRAATPVIIDSRGFPWYDAEDLPHGCRFGHARTWVTVRARRHADDLVSSYCQPGTGVPQLGGGIPGVWNGQHLPDIVTLPGGYSLHPWVKSGEHATPSLTLTVITPDAYDQLRLPAWDARAFDVLAGAFRRDPYLVTTVVVTLHASGVTVLPTLAATTADAVAAPASIS